MHRVNISLDDNAWTALQEIPLGKRSKMVSQAINNMTDLMNKKNAARKMDALRQKLPKEYSAAQITGWIREDRRR